MIPGARRRLSSGRSSDPTWTPRAASCPPEIPPAVNKKRRPSGRNLGTPRSCSPRARLGIQEGLRLPSGGRNRVEPAGLGALGAVPRPEEDRAVLIPVGVMAACRRQGADPPERIVVEVELVELSFGEEPDESAVRRPERLAPPYLPSVPLSGRVVSDSSEWSQSILERSPSSGSSRSARITMWRPSGEGTGQMNVQPSGASTVKRTAGLGSGTSVQWTKARVAARPVATSETATKPQLSLIRRWRSGPGTPLVSPATASASGAVPARTSCSARRAPPMSGSRVRGSLRRQRARSQRMTRGVSVGSASRSGSSFTTAAMMSVTVSPAKSARPVSISHRSTPKAHTSPRLSTALPRACSGDM